MSDLDYYYKKGKRDLRKYRAYATQDNEEYWDELRGLDKSGKSSHEAWKAVNGRFYNPPHRDISDKNQRQKDEEEAYNEGWSEW